MPPPAPSSRDVPPRPRRGQPALHRARAWREARSPLGLALTTAGLGLLAVVTAAVGYYLVVVGALTLFFGVGVVLLLVGAAFFSATVALVAGAATTTIFAWRRTRTRAERALVLITVVPALAAAAALLDSQVAPSSPSHGPGGSRPAPVTTYCATLSPTQHFDGPVTCR